MPDMKIHPRFRLNGLRPGDDPAVFCQELEKTLPAGEASAAYAREATDFLYRCLDAGRTIRCHTSGSTGVPKTMEIEKSRMVASARMTCRRFDLGEDTRALLCLPIAYIAGRMMLVRALTAGWDLRAVVPSSRPLEQVEGRFDFAALVPLQLYESVEALSRIRKVLVGGGAVSEAFLSRLAECRLPETAIYQSYAMTETVTHVAVRELYPSGEKAYTALDGVCFSLSEEGCLVIDAPAVAGERVMTRDRAVLLDQRHFLWQGRADTVINSGGIKIFPEDTEEVLAGMLPAGRFLVGGVSDERLGERQVLFVEGCAADFPDLEVRMREAFDPYHRPRQVVFVPLFPRTSTGKVDRMRLLREAAAGN